VSRVRIKFCGMMRAEDAAAASRLGADAIGMIFHPPSRRNTTLEQAGQIIRALGPFVTPVGVFVDAGTPRIVEVARSLGLRIVQLHGREDPAQVAEAGATGLKVIKSVRVDATLPQQLAQWRLAMTRLKDVLIGLVMETGNTAQAGGTGLTNDWHAIRRHREAGDFAGLPSLIVAGGLTPENVGSVIQHLQPQAVDVSTGIESSPGVKSEERMLAFVDAVQRAPLDRTQPKLP
jgi:phosphoribosylanthranilate isomerase